MDLNRMRMKIVLMLSVPIASSLFAQVIVLLINSAMVGHLGVAALAGVGVAGEIYTVFSAILFGIDAGVQALVARRSGEGKLHLAGDILTDAIATSVLLGAVLATIAFAAGPMMLAMILHNADAVEQGKPYLLVAAPALLFVGANYAFNAYWNGSGVPKFTLLVTVIQLPLSVLFSYVLMFGPFGLPALGTAGLALGSMLATLIALAANVLLATRIRPVPLLMKKPPSLSGMGAVLNIGLPISLEQSTLHLGTATFFVIVGILGAHQVAVVNVLIGLDHLAILPAIGIGIATATVVGASLGGKDVAGARQWGWEGGAVGTLVVLPVSLLILLFPGTILHLFIHDDAVAALGVWPARFLALSMCVNTFGRIVGFGLRGSGATKTISIVNTGMNWLVQLPMAWLVGVGLGYGLFGIALSRFVLLAVEAAIIVALWRRGDWAKVKVPPAVEADVSTSGGLVAAVEVAQAPGAAGN
ncbi:MAG: MATE family efflux transporter [Alphaproteobacteria bacterium]|nr:MATE family efflux transporter [Alphaproteobacteria bacterium]